MGAEAEDQERKPTETVGVIFVHGVGEQGAFEHLEGGAVELVQSLIARESKTKRVTASINTSGDAIFRATQQTWRSEDRAPVTIDVTDKRTGRFTRIELREVWWADLGEEAGLRNLFRFLWWGCTLWGRPPYKAPKAKSHGHAGFTLNMFTPRGHKGKRPALGERDDTSIPPGLLDRAQLFLIAGLFLLILPTWYLLGLTLQLLRLPTIPSAGILLQYLGDVKLYGQKRRHGRWPLADMGTPPRFLIRRRFVRTMIDTALGGYSRWYVLGHSLGSVVALNGLMEPEHSLPNYLDESRWAKCRRCFLAQLPAETLPPVDGMIPGRPAWLEDTDGIDRAALFARFRGLLTYGSPLDKFAVLFPATVALNRQRGVFPEDAEWINVFEPTDPVGGVLDFFGPFAGDDPSEAGRDLVPTNYGIRCWPVLLWSHIKYFAGHHGETSPFSDAVQKWLLDGATFAEAFEGAKGVRLTEREAGLRRVSRFIQVAIFSVITVAIFVALWRFIDPIGYLLKGIEAVWGYLTNVDPDVRSWARTGAATVVIALVVVAVLGVLAFFVVDPQPAAPEDKKRRHG